MANSADSFVFELAGFLFRVTILVFPLPGLPEPFANACAVDWLSPESDPSEVEVVLRVSILSVALMMTMS